MPLFESPGPRIGRRSLTNPTAAPGPSLPPGATGDIYFRNAAGVTVRLPIGAEGQQLKVVSGTPQWRTP
jgi:hypothetical protein